MSESPEAMRKYIAPSPRPVIVRRTKVSTSVRSAHAEVAPHRDRVAEQLARGTSPDDAALVEHDRVLGEALHDAEVLLDEQDRLRLRRTLEHARDLRHGKRRGALRR